VLLRLERRAQPLIEPSNRPRYEDLVSALFSAWQPTVREAARKILPRRAFAAVCKALGSALDRKPGETDLETWVALFDLLVDLDDARAWHAIHAAAVRLGADQQSLVKPTQTCVRRPSDERRRP
jgi:hypothetical protein